MSKVYLEYNSLKVNCVINIEDTISYLNQVIRYLEQPSIPNDFSKRSLLLNTISDLKNNKTKLTNIRNWIVNSNSNYDSLLENLKLQASKLPVIQVRSRVSIM